MSQTVHIRLELRADGDCFAGRAISDEGSREFHGWMGLMGAVEALYPPSGTSMRHSSSREPEAPSGAYDPPEWAGTAEDLPL